MSPSSCCRFYLSNTMNDLQSQHELTIDNSRSRTTLNKRNNYQQRVSFVRRMFKTHTNYIPFGLTMVFVLLLQLLTEVQGNTSGNSIGGNGLSDLEMEHPERLPSFITPGQTYRIATGATVVLPCRVSEPGSYVLAWKRGIAVLTAGPVKVSPDPRVRLLSTPQSSSPLPGLSGGGYSLELRDVRPQDAGDYICQIGTFEPREITHTLEILVPPRIHHVSHTGRVEVSQGSTVKLECRASGNPVPTVGWTRKNNVLPSGERSVTGLTLLLQHVDRHSAGQYQCSADNGVAQPDTRTINLVVRYPPEVETERPSVHTGIGMEAQLVCIVHAEPPPHVTWYKDTTQLGTTEKHATQTRGNRHTLIIRNVSSADFGNYSCLAGNTLGKARGHLALSGTAAAAVFESPPLGDSPHSYNLTWSVASYSPVTEFRLFFRPQPIHQRQLHHDIDLNSVHKMDYNVTYIQGSYMGRSDWSSVILPGPTVYSGTTTYPTLTRQYMSYILRGLQPATHYEARVQAKNAHGWNRISPTFHFTTRGEVLEPVVEQSAQPAVYGISSMDPGLSLNAAPKLVSTFATFITILELINIHL